MQSKRTKLNLSLDFNVWIFFRDGMIGYNIPDASDNDPAVCGADQDVYVCSLYDLIKDHFNIYLTGDPDDMDLGEMDAKWMRDVADLLNKTADQVENYQDRNPI